MKKNSDKLRLKCICVQSGFTLIEFVLVIVIIGILIGVAVQNGGKLFETAKIEETRQKMDALAKAISGNHELENNGVRTDFGYVGDVGAMPPNLDALHSNPGGYSTWNGPYIENSFEQITDDYKKDAWQVDYTYTGGITLVSTGSGSSIIRNLTGSANHLLRNTVKGNIFDLDGTPPGSDYRDSITIRLTIPDGSGSLMTKSCAPDKGGYFSFDSIPIGNHNIEIIYIPDDDTLRRFVSVLPNSVPYARYCLASDIWTSGAFDLDKVAGSDSLYADCHGFYFWIENNTGGTISVDSVTLTWTGTTAYYRYIKWDGTTVFSRNNPKVASGEKVGLSSVQVINDGESLRVDFDFFKANPTGGGNVDMDNLTFTVLLSDGSEITVTTGNCP